MTPGSRTRLLEVGARVASGRSRVLCERSQYAAYRGVDADQQGGSRLVELWVTTRAAGVSVRVVASGFASMKVPIEDQVAQHEQNTKTERRQLELIRARLESSGASAG